MGEAGIGNKKCQGIGKQSMLVYNLTAYTQMNPQWMKDCPTEH